MLLLFCILYVICCIARGLEPHFASTNLHLYYHQWKYVDIDELKEILAEKIDDGFAFPLNPKWILCDEGWKDLYDKLLASNASNVPEAMDIWYPADVRERITAISSKHPNGFGSSKQPGMLRRRQAKRGAITQVELEEISADLAELQLERYKRARTGLKKLRKAIPNTSEKSQKSIRSKSLSFFSSVLLMSRTGKQHDDMQIVEANFCCNETVIKKQGRRVTRRVSFSSDHTSSSAASVTSSPESYGKNSHEREQGRSRRKSLSQFIRKKRLSFSLSSKNRISRRSSV